MLPGQQQSNPYSLYILLTLLLLMVYTVAGNWFEHKHIHVIHETGLGILIGIVAGGILFWTDNREGLEGFSGEIFFYALLPPIIFEGGYNLKKSRLFQNFNYISIFGILGTLVSFFVIYGLTHVINSQGWIRPSNNFSKPIFLTQQLIMLYSATICATDSVAALTMIKPDKYPKLFSIVFGQGMVNDAVAIILFRAVGQLHHTSSDHDQSDTAPIVSIIENFLLNLACSLLIGLVSGLFCTFVCKHIRKLTEKAENYVLEISLSFFFGFLAYGAAELSEFSGVISVLVCGISMAHFNFYNLSQNGQLLTGQHIRSFRVSFKAISFGCESFLFVYLGMESWFYLSGQKQWSLTFILLQLIICSIARFACIFGLSGFFYLFMRKKWSVNFYQLAIIWFAGIIRGSVAFALILTIQAPEHQLVQVIQSTVLIMVFLTTIILGGIMPNFVSCCLARAQLMQQKKAQAKLTISANLLPPEVAGSMVLSIEEEPPREKKEKGCAKRVWGNIDEKYLKPFFIYNYELRKDEIKLAKKKMKMNSDAFKGASDVFKKPSLLGSDAEDKSKKDQHVLGPIEEEEDKDMS